MANFILLNLRCVSLYQWFYDFYMRISISVILEVVYGKLNLLYCCKLEITFKWKTRLSSSSWYNDPTPKYIISGVVYKFQCGLCNESCYGKSIKHLDLRSEEHIGVSPLTWNKVEPINNCDVRDHLLHCNYLLVFWFIKIKSIY